MHMLCVTKLSGIWEFKVKVKLNVEVNVDKLIGARVFVGEL